MAGLLQGHIAAVTGGGSGIGQGICQAYAREGARIIVLDANLEGANETVGLVTGAGGKASAVKLDVTDRQACKAAAAEIAKGGNVSILVNNAGINRRNPINAAAVTKDWDDILSINLDGVFNVTHAFLDQIRATKGRIVNIGSIQSFVHVSWPNSAAYTTSKHGVLGFTRARDQDQRRGTGQESRHGRQCHAAHAAEPRRQARGHRGTGALPRVRFVVLRHGQHHHGRRRLPHALTATE